MKCVRNAFCYHGRVASECSRHHPLYVALVLLHCGSTFVYCGCSVVALEPTNSSTLAVSYRSKMGV